MYIGVAVVQVLDYRLNCSPNGNFINPDLGTLEKAKFQFFAGRAADINFGDDFLKLYANLMRLQNDIAVTKEHRDMLHTDASGKMICFARNVFEKRVGTHSFVIESQTLTVYKRRKRYQTLPVQFIIRMSSSITLLMLMRKLLTKKRRTGLLIGNSATNLTSSNLHIKLFLSAFTKTTNSSNLRT